MRHLVYRELVEERNVFHEFMDINNLKSALDAFFSSVPSPASPRRSLKTAALGLRRISPAVFYLAHKSGYYARTWLGRRQDPLHFDRLITRLLILKVWGDVFLNYPVVKTPNLPFGTLEPHDSADREREEAFPHETTFRQEPGA